MMCHDREHELLLRAGMTQVVEVTGHMTRQSRMIQPLILQVPRTLLCRLVDYRRLPRRWPTDEAAPASTWLPVWLMLLRHNICRTHENGGFSCVTIVVVHSEKSWVCKLSKLASGRSRLCSKLEHAGRCRRHHGNDSNRDHGT